MNPISRAHSAKDIGASRGGSAKTRRWVSAAVASATLALPAGASAAPNLALAANGGTITASSSLSGYPATGANDGVFETTTGGGYWNDNTNNSYPDTLKVSWSSAQTIGRVTLRMPVASNLTLGQRTVGPIEVQYLNGGTWTTIATTNGQPNPISSWVVPIAADGSQVKQFYFNPVSTTAVQVVFSRGNSDGWSYLDELEVYDTTQIIDYDAAVSWLEGEATSLEAGSHAMASNHTTLYTPDDALHYDALWTRDFEYMLEGRPQGVGAADAAANINYLIAGQRADGAIPDRVNLDGSAVYSVITGQLPPTDNPSFLVKAVYQYYQFTGDLTLFNNNKSQLVAGMNSIPMSGNLVYIDPASPHTSYGFTDTIQKTGNELFTSLLYYDASQCLGTLFDLVGDTASANTWWTTANTVFGAVQSLADPVTGLYYAATVDDRQFDVWGSAFAVFLGVAGPHTTDIANWLVANYAGLAQNGQFRHLTPGEYWDYLLVPATEEPVGTYQNGAFWGTPSGWIAYAIAQVNPSLARQTIIDLANYGQSVGPYEAYNLYASGSCGVYCGAAGYVATAAAPLFGITKMSGPDLALGDWGGTATASSSLAGYPVSAANNGRPDIPWGYWNDGTQTSYPDTVGITWGSSAVEINKIVLRMPVVSYLTVGQRTIGSLTLQYWNGSGWQTIVTNNDQPNPVLNWTTPTTPDGTEERTFRFSPITTTQIQVRFDTGNSDGWSYIEEIQAFNSPI
ncbi:MAG TPA: hypothetical protein VHO06_21680 [Polyangia bacterium]|nr:hypothetical protein [Polyangia bacterium]